MHHITRIHHAEPLSHPLTIGATAEGFIQGIKIGVLEHELRGIKEKL
jgi:hypothetical protein